MTILPTEQRGTARWRRGAAWTGGTILALVLLTAAWAKALDPAAFAEQVAHEGLDFLLPASLLAWAVVVVEVTLGVALLLGLRTKTVLGFTAALIVVFVFLTGRAYWRWLSGIEIEGPDCGCFGSLLLRSPAEAFWQDLLLLLPPYALCWLHVVSGSGARVLGKWGLVVTAGLGAGVFFLQAPSLPLDDLATRLAPGVRVGGLCAGSASVASERICLDLLIPELDDGRHVVVIENLENLALGETVDVLNGLVGTGLSVWMLSSADDVERQMFFWEWGPLFEVREAPVALLRPLYRTLPRSFLVDSGVVLHTWSGVPEFNEVGDAL